MPFVLLYLVVEIVALVALGSAVGLGWTLLILLVGALVGMWLARREGVRAAQALAEAVSQRRAPTAELTDGMLVAAGGVLLFVPGLVTDLAGLLLLLPPVRRVVRNRLVRVAEERVPELRTARIRSGATIVDGDVVRPRPDVRVIEAPRPQAPLRRGAVHFAEAVGSAKCRLALRSAARSRDLTLSSGGLRIADTRRSTTRHRVR